MTERLSVVGRSDMLPPAHINVLLTPEEDVFVTETSVAPVPLAGGCLPPRSVWRGVDPHDEKIPTPLDSVGVVDKKKLLQLATSHLDPSYTLPRWSINDHHLQWPGAAYTKRQMADGRYSPWYFRDLPSMKARIPRYLENWIHYLTLPPPVPTDEVMMIHCDSWHVTQQLFRAAKALQKLPREKQRRVRSIEAQLVRPKFGQHDPIGQAQFHHSKSRYEDSYAMYMSRLAAIPAEFRLLEPGMSPKEVSSKVGRLVVKRSHLLVRMATQQIAA